MSHTDGASLRAATVACLHSFENLCNDLEAKVGYGDILKDIVDEGRRLRIWGANLGALAGGHSALDWRLRDANLMRTVVLQLLHELESLLNSTHSLIEAGDDVPVEDPSSKDDDCSDAISLPSDDDGDRGNDTSSNRLDIFFKGIVETIQSLYKLALRIRGPNSTAKSSRASRYKELIPDTNRDLFGDYFAPHDQAHIIELLATLRCLDHTSSSSITFSTRDKVLISRLTEANVTRRRQFRYWEKHNQKLATIGTSHDQSVPQVFQIKNERDAPPSQGLHQIQHASKPIAPSNGSKSIHTTTEATRYDSKLDLGSLETESVVSIATTARDLGGHVAELPPPPTAAAEGSDFVCSYCFVLCSPKYGSSRGWRYLYIIDVFLQGLLTTTSEPTSYKTFSLMCARIRIVQMAVGSTALAKHG
ncbi:hypothetical protein AAFC00_006805 [Neodothiora populina]|uniref:Prion-inhibition and propagation HeLo domain-containing protein n=1 Tax=Neodothiora populina TaxID=2781224 RepID=A0ABR3PBD1_9PEZI